MPKEWFILICNSKEGPYDFNDLKQDYRITPDTLVWKAGMPNWIAARFVPELKEIFADEGQSNDQEEEEDNEESSEKSSSTGSYDETLAMQNGSPNLLIWIIFALLIMLYAIYQLFTAR